MRKRIPYADSSSLSMILHTSMNHIAMSKPRSLLFPQLPLLFLTLPLALEVLSLIDELVPLAVRGLLPTHKKCSIYDDNGDDGDYVPHTMITEMGKKYL